jgi:hypothetical protein
VTLLYLSPFVAADQVVYDEVACDACLSCQVLLQSEHPQCCVRCGRPHPSLNRDGAAAVGYLAYIELPNTSRPLNAFGRVRSVAAPGPSCVTVEFVPYAQTPLSLNPLAVVYNVPLAQIEYSPRGWAESAWLPRRAQQYLATHIEYAQPEAILLRYRDVISPLGLPYGQEPHAC